MSKKIIFGLVLTLLIILPIGYASSSDIISEYKIDYSNNVAKVNLSLENKTSNTYPLIIKFYDNNNILDKKIEDKILILNSLESKSLDLELNLNKAGKINYEILFSNKKISNEINFNTEIKPENKPKYNIVAFFGLSNFELPLNTLMIILNIFLFIVAVLLFTMFIGRLGKIIIKR